MFAAIKAFVAAEDGAAMVEYVLMAFLIAAVCFLAVATLGTHVNGQFDSVQPAFNGS